MTQKRVYLQPYKLRPPRVDALQLTKDFTLSDIEAFSHYGEVRVPKASTSHPRPPRAVIVLSIKGQDHPMSLGDWLVVESYVARVMTDDAFREMYEPDTHESSRGDQ